MKYEIQCKNKTSKDPPAPLGEIWLTMCVVQSVNSVRTRLALLQSPDAVESMWCLRSLHEATLWDMHPLLL